MDRDRLVLADEAAYMARVQPATIRQWSHRYPESLPVRGHDWRGRCRYRLGDVLDVECATRTGVSLTR